MSSPHPANDAGSFSSGASDTSPYAKYLGAYRAIYCGYASREGDRQNVASGGLVTALLAFALRSRTVDGVALGRGSFKNNHLGYDFDIVTEPEAIQEYGTSAYFNIPIERHWKQIDDFQGRVALCGLPCHASILRHRRSAGGALQNLRIFVSLFCGHNNEIDLLHYVLAKEGIQREQVTQVRVDRTYLGGSVRVHLNDGSVRNVPFRDFNVYRSLWYFSKAMCRYCDDHLGGSADLSIGDIFVREYRRQPIKHSAMIVRTDVAQDLVQAAIAAGVVTLNTIEPSVVFRAQKRVLVPSHDLLSRYYACRTVGFTAKKPESGSFRVRSYLTYTLLMLNDRMSKRPGGATLLRWIPRPLLYAYIAAIKLVNTSLRAET